MDNKPGGPTAATARESAPAEQPVPYAKSGEVVTEWINKRLSERGNVTIPLGTKRATVNRLLPEGRLECEVPDADRATSQQQHIAFDEKMLDMLLPMLAKV